MIEKFNQLRDFKAIIPKWQQPLISCKFLFKMKPKSQETSGQIDLFNTSLADLLNPKHELYQLAHLIDWKVLDDAFGEFFAETQGAPALPTRLIAGLYYLKHAFARSDEAVVAQWLENPYWQYFCGEAYFQYQTPCHPTSLTYWRKRIGEAGCEWMLSVTIQTGLDSKTVKKQDFESVTVDSTIQEKAITYPTDGKLYERCRQHMVRLAEQHEIPLRQNYNRKAPYLLMMANPLQPCQANEAQTQNAQATENVGGTCVPRYRAPIGGSTRLRQIGFQRDAGKNPTDFESATPG